MNELIDTLKEQIIEVLNLEDMRPSDIDAGAPLFGYGLGLDSIDALELIVLMEREYGIKLTKARRFSSQWLLSLITSARIARNKGNVDKSIRDRSGDNLRIGLRHERDSEIVA